MSQCGPRWRMCCQILAALAVVGLIDLAIVVGLERADKLFGVLGTLVALVSLIGAYVWPTPSGGGSVRAPARPLPAGQITVVVAMAIAVSVVGFAMAGTFGGGHPGSMVALTPSGQPSALPSLGVSVGVTRAPSVQPTVTSRGATVGADTGGTKATVDPVPGAAAAGTAEADPDPCQTPVPTSMISSTRAAVLVLLGGREVVVSGLARVVRAGQPDAVLFRPDLQVQGREPILFDTMAEVQVTHDKHEDGKPPAVRIIGKTGRPVQGRLVESGCLAGPQMGTSEVVTVDLDDVLKIIFA